MKQILVIAISLLISVIGCSQTAPNENSPISSKIDSVSYSIGQDIGKNFKKQDIEIDPKIMLQGMVDAMADSSLLTDEEIQKVMMNLLQEKRREY